MILRAAQRLDALAMRHAFALDVLGNRRGADETDRVHVRVAQQCVDRDLVAIDHVEHAVRQAGFLEPLR